MTQELYHHGIKGQKWGVRRFQNEDGSLTTAGRKRYSEGEKKQLDKEKLIKIGAAALLTGTVAAAAYAYSKNRKDINAAVSLAMEAIGNKTINASKKVATKGKNYVKSIEKATVSGVKQGLKNIPVGIENGLSNAPKKVAQGLAEGAAIIGAKKILDNSLGQDSYDTVIGAYNAYNKKNKIGKVNYKKKDDDEEDDD